MIVTDLIFVLGMMLSNSAFFPGLDKKPGWKNDELVASPDYQVFANFICYQN